MSTEMDKDAELGDAAKRKGKYASLIAWWLAKGLTKLPQTASVIWWTAALMRFSLTGRNFRIVKVGEELF